MPDNKQGLFINGMIMAKTKTEFEGKEYHKIEVAAVGVPMIIQLSVSSEQFHQSKEGAPFNHQITCKLNQRNQTKFAIAA